MNKIIQIHRGDTITIRPQLNIGTGVHPEYYELQDGDVVYFGLMEPHQRWEDAILKDSKTYADVQFEREVRFDISTEDTQNLLEGIYYYEVKLYIACDKANHGLESVKTIIPKTKFIILE